MKNLLSDMGDIHYTLSCFHVMEIQSITYYNRVYRNMREWGTLPIYYYTIYVWVFVQSQFLPGFVL